MRWFLLFFFSALLVCASPTTVTENDPSTLVDGVSVITGDFYLGEEDYVVAGAEPIAIRRFYLSSVGGIDQYPHLTATFVLSMDTLVVHEPNGTPVTYSRDPNNKTRGTIGEEFYGKRKQPLRYQSADFAKTSLGIANTSTGTLSAKSQLKNQTIVFDPGIDPKGKSFSLYASDGSVRRYLGYLGQEKEDFGPYGKGYLAYYYRLCSETLPNGRILHYEWDDKNRLLGMRTSNPRNTKTLARLPFPKLDPKRLGQSYSLAGSDGRSVSYNFRPAGKKRFELAQVVSPEQADQYFSSNGERIAQISLPNGRTLVIQYQGSKVSQLLAPLGLQGALIPYYQFSYDEGAKTSYCLDALGNQTSYFWSDAQRITRIERFEGRQLRKNSENFVWDGANLRCKVFYDEKDAPIFAKTWDYDPKGNVLEEIVWGNISGRGPPLHIGPDGMPLEDSVERAITRNAYDARNLVKRRTEPSGLITEYTYLPNAELPTSKTLLCEGAIFSQTTYSYDSDNNLIREVIEEGAQSCKIREIILRTAEPYIDLPDQIVEKYAEQGVEKLLKKTKLHYTNGALISKKEVYDGDDALRYSLQYQYDPKGRVLEESNAIGQNAISRYDAVGNRIYFKEFSERKETTFDYDLANRLIKKVKKGFDGIEQAFLYSYDEKHNLKAETDPYRNTILYEYDAFGQRTKITHPLQSIRHGPPQSAIEQTRYDSQGNPISQIDALGNETRGSYNALGKPIRIVHPNGAVEENVYNLDGTLAEHIDPLGIKTKYKYDALGHLIQRQTDEAIETFVYEGSLLSQSIDAEGTKTLYRYDGAGRKIAEETAGEVTQYTYDPLGRVASQIEGNLITLYQYDLLDRLLEEKQTSASGSLLQITQYDYDAAGNQSAVTQGQKSVERFDYDSLDRRICKTDPLGAVETIEYETLQNDIGQNVLQKRVTDPLGLQTIEVFDAQKRLASLQKRKDAPLLTESFYYDLNGQKIAQEEQIHHKDGSQRTILNEWQYDAGSRLIALTEGNGAKITRYGYNLRGDKTSTLKPDGVAIFYEYNPLGHLYHLFSSDKSVDHRLDVDRLDRLIGFDGIKRKLDPKGRLLEEHFPNEVTIKNRYDTRGRKEECSIPIFDLTVEYRHGPLHLEEVIFQNQTHAYTDYDLSGNLCEERLPCHLGALKRTYDLAQRPRSSEHPRFTQTIEEYDRIGNIIAMSVEGVRQTYSYDPLYQLTSETGAFCHSYTFDPLYNRLTKDTEIYEINALNQAISHCTYDLNGNPTHIGSTCLFYDALDRLVRVETPQETQTFTYDYLNRCLSQTTKGDKTLYFLYDGQNEIGSFDETLRDFRALGRTESAEISAAVFLLINHSLYIPLHDLQGNIAKILPIDASAPSHDRYTERNSRIGEWQGGSSNFSAGESGSAREHNASEAEQFEAKPSLPKPVLESRVVYSAFGEETCEGPTLSPWRFSSKRVNPLTGFVNYGRRYYVPSMGRWLTPDPLGLTAGTNLYAFVQNDPLVHLDEYGLMLKPAYSPSKEEAKAAHRFQTATAHEIGHQFIQAGRFFSSLPHYGEQGLSSLTGRQSQLFSSWQEKQTQFFDRIEEWMYRALPTDRTHSDYLTYRRGVSPVIEWGSLTGIGYGVVKRGIKAARWGVNTWKLKKGTFVAGEKLASIVNAKYIQEGTNINSGIWLKSKLAALSKAQQKAHRTRTLSDGRIRYYMPEVPATNTGSTRGASYVTEWDPRKGSVRSWMESYACDGKVSRVHPKMINGQTLNCFHYPPIGEEIRIK